MPTIAKAAIASIISIVIACAIPLALSSAPSSELPSQADSPELFQSSLDVSDIDITEEEMARDITYPTGWLAISDQGIPALVPIKILNLPGFDITPRVSGHATAMGKETATAPSDEAMARVEFDGVSYDVDPSILLVNMPDFLPDVIYDIRYAYDTPSRAGGIEIPDLTGIALDGYAPKSESLYLSKDQFAVPCYYETALKLAQADRILWDEYGYRLVIWDIYRPYRASSQISDAFKKAYSNNLAIRAATGGWDLSWYAADGTSGHNYGTDIDLAVANAQGEILPLPSDFDAFDTTGHLATSQMNSSAITESSYTQSVLASPACMALHRAMREAGFSELASEWWHFADKEGESNMRNLVGRSGLDFIASAQ